MLGFAVMFLILSLALGVTAYQERRAWGASVLLGHTLICALIDLALWFFYLRMG
jgi:hypothetical protein